MCGIQSLADSSHQPVLAPLKTSGEWPLFFFGTKKCDCCCLCSIKLLTGLAVVGSRLYWTQRAIVDMPISWPSRKDGTTSDRALRSCRPSSQHVKLAQAKSRKQLSCKRYGPFFSRDRVLIGSIHRQLTTSASS